MTKLLAFVAYLALMAGIMYGNMTLAWGVPLKSFGWFLFFSVFATLIAGFIGRSITDDFMKK